MNPPRANLFSALFEFRPRDGHTPKENFLTEAFAYFLRTDDRVQTRWLSKLLDREVDGATCEVRTRQTEQDVDADTSVYPDLLLEGQFSDGKEFAVYCEHKWDSPCDDSQLRRYQKIADAKGVRLAFVGATCVTRTTTAWNCIGTARRTNGPGHRPANWRCSPGGST
jgi:hypothetical protein